jgi:hypothetical protein
MAKSSRPDTDEEAAAKRAKRAASQRARRAKIKAAQAEEREAHEDVAGERRVPGIRVAVPDAMLCVVERQ